MVRPELRLRGRSASEEGAESLCDTVLCCIFLVMRCVRLRCVWFCVFLLGLGSQALLCMPPNGGELLVSLRPLVWADNGGELQSVSCVRLSRS